MTLNERWQAHGILFSLLKNKQTLNQLFAAQQTLTPLTKNLCFGVCRHFFALEVLIQQLVKKKPDLEISLVLMIGLYQLKFLNKPDYAVVNETVALVNKLKQPWAKGLVNGVLRRFGREQTEIIKTAEKNPIYQTSHPQWFIKRLKQDWSNWPAILDANNQLPPMSLRVNQQKITAADYLNQLALQGTLAVAHQLSPVGIRLAEPCDVLTLPGFAAGMVAVQDESAQLAVSLLDLKPGQRVLDACAAPGGKTCHILEHSPDLAECVAIDIDERRLTRIHDNLKRLQLKATVLVGDALTPATWWDGQLFDRILLDAPCSATGVIRRHPDIKLLRTEEEVSEIVEIQAALLKALWPLVRPGGRLVYSTCSVLKQENEMQIRQFLVSQSDCAVEKVTQTIGHSNEFGWQLFPGELDNDGFFYSILKKNDATI